MDEKILNELYKETLKAYKKNEIPVGAVIIKNNKIVAKAHNNRQNSHSVLGHAEIQAIIKAEKKTKDWRLNGYTMLVNLEPCELCQRVIKESRIDKVFYILKSKNNTKIIANLKQTNVCNNWLIKFQQLMDNFFSNLRKK